MNATASGEPLAYSIKEASRATSLGRTRLYQLIADGRLEVVKIGNRTLIPARALHKLLEGDR
ncbi:MAG: helix-turn-helix domain-containing protein [Sphingobium sp.]